MFYGFSITFAAVDWAMSLSPHWYSTIYGLLFLAGQGLSALSFCIALLVILSDEGGPLEGVIGPAHFHDIGKLLFAFTMLWAYFSYSQFLIIWAGNLTKEIPWYMERLKGGWQWIGMLLVVFHFALPVCLAALAHSKARRPHSSAHRRPHHLHALRRPVLVGRTRRQQERIPPPLDGYSGAHRNRRIVAGDVSVPAQKMALTPGARPALGRGHCARRRR